MDEFEFHCGAVSSRFSYPSIMYCPFYVIKYFFTPITFVFHLLFGLVEVVNTPKFVLAIIDDIITIELYGDWCR